MSNTNPTRLQIGMTGELSGRTYRVVGRVVMGMEDGGETYYWNEFNLETDNGESATLVYEETERGGEWRLFIMFEPEYPMDAADAASKRVGDPLNLEGTEVRVTLVDESRVYHIESRAPEGVEVGDVAHYFNAESGNNMVVVSWSGDEVEYYRGITLPRELVSQAFNLKRELPASAFSSEEDDAPENHDTMGQFALKSVCVVLALAVLYAGISLWRSKYPGRVVKTPAPTAHLPLGSSGNLGDRHYVIQGHAVVEIAQVGLLYDRHEYQILDDDGNTALLVYGLNPKSKDWFLFTPLHPMDALTPQKAASIHRGDTLNIDGVVAPVTELFRSTIRQADLENTATPVFKAGDVHYGFVGGTAAIQLLAQWNDASIAFYQGRALPAKDVTASFSRQAN